MTQAISRESFDELKNYLGVYLQQGRAILDSDWNENQDIAVSFMRRVGREAFGDGSPNQGFVIDPVFPPPPALLLSTVDTTGMSFEEALGAIIGACLADLVQLMMYLLFGPVLFFLTFPGEELDSFESLQGWALGSPQGALRLGRDRPAAGESFLRLSGHPGTVQLTRTLGNVADLSHAEFATFKFRLDRQTPGPVKFFLEDVNGNRSIWRFTNAAVARDLWLSGFAAPLDLRFHILTDALPPGAVGESYDGNLTTFGATTPVTWTVSAGALPAGLTLAAGGDPEEAKAEISGTPTAAGSTSFTVKGTDAAGAVATHEYTLEVRPTAPSSPALQLPTGLEFLAGIAKTETVNGPADLTQIRKYGFEVYQDTAAPLVWDFDELRLGSSELERSMGANNFIIRGSEVSKLINQLTLMGVMAQSDEDDDGDVPPVPGDSSDNLLALLNTEFDLTTPSVATAGRYYVAGLPCIQVEDVLYSEQADPNDPPLAPPPAGTTRTDVVYLDAWTEPVTYVDDPSIREIALGGPDTATRRRVRHRVRVAQGAAAPIGDGVGEGTLATAGIYTARENRLYRVEIEDGGDIGTATFRWSQDNASTLQRVIEPVPPGSTKVVVEDGSAFHPGDLVLLRKEFGAEHHQVASVLGNAIRLAAASGTELAALPAAAADPEFTTFAVADRPALQRWDAFGVPIAADPADATISGAIPLGPDGIQVRFGGRAMVPGDHWTFNTRYLAGDEASGIDPVTRIERLDWQRARGVVHHYAPLAVLVRDGDADDPDMIFAIRDRRLRTGGSSTTSVALPKLTGFAGQGTVHLGGMALPPTTLESKFLVFWSGDLFLPAAAAGKLRIRISFYNDQAIDPAADPDTGKIQDRETTLPLNRRPAGVDIPLSLNFAKSDLSFAFLTSSLGPCVGPRLRDARQRRRRDRALEHATDGARAQEGTLTRCPDTCSPNATSPHCARCSTCRWRTRRWPRRSRSSASIRPPAAGRRSSCPWRCRAATTRTASRCRRSSPTSSATCRLCPRSPCAAARCG